MPFEKGYTPWNKGNRKPGSTYSRDYYETHPGRVREAINTIQQTSWTFSSKCEVVCANCHAIRTAERRRSASLVEETSVVMEGGGAR